MKMRILAVSAIALLCATGAGVAQDNAGAGAAGSATLCSTLNSLTGDTQKAFLQGYQAGMVDASLSGGMNAGQAGAAASTDTQAAAGGAGTPAPDAGAQKAANGENNNNTAAATQAAGAGATTNTQTAAAGAGTPAPDAGAQKVANGEANNNTASVAASMGMNMDWTPVISGCASAPNSTISSLRPSSASK